MSLHGDLLDQAEMLAKVEPYRPRQASLRRAVSAAYYAVFHLLTSEAATLYTTEPGMAARIARTFNHAEMKKASQFIGKHRLPNALQQPGGGYETPVDVKIVADAFVELQAARHEADYDVSRKYLREEVLNYVDLARQAFQAWDKVRKGDGARLYLACFHLWNQWDQKTR